MFVRSALGKTFIPISFVSLSHDVNTPESVRTKTTTAANFDLRKYIKSKKVRV